VGAYGISEDEQDRNEVRKWRVNKVDECGLSVKNPAHPSTARVPSIGGAVPKTRKA